MYIKTLSIIRTKFLKGYTITKKMGLYFTKPQPIVEEEASPIMPVRVLSRTFKNGVLPVPQEDAPLRRAGSQRRKEGARTDKNYPAHPGLVPPHRTPPILRPAG